MDLQTARAPHDGPFGGSWSLPWQWQCLPWPRHATTEGCTPRALPNGPFRCPFGFALVMNQWGLTWSPGRGLEQHVHSSTARGGARPDHSWSKTFRSRIFALCFMSQGTRYYTIFIQIRFVFVYLTSLIHIQFSSL